MDIDLLTRACPQLLQQSDIVEWDDTRGTLKAFRRSQIGKLTLGTKPLAKPSEEELHRAMLNGIREKGLSVLNWTPEAEQYRIRLHCAAKWLPEQGWPAVDDEMLLAMLEQWLLPQMSGVHSLRALKALDVKAALQNLLDWSLRQRLDSELLGITLCQPGAGLPFVIMRIIRRRWRFGCRRCLVRPPRRPLLKAVCR